MQTLRDVLRASPYFGSYVAANGVESWVFKGTKTINMTYFTNTLDLPIVDRDIFLEAIEREVG